MGGGTWSADDWKSYSKTTSTRSARENFKATSTKKDMSPLNVVRESCDSPAHPKSTPVIVAMDVTGSMQRIPQYMVSTGLGVLFNEILNRKPITDPQVAVYAFGDVYYDRSPLQVSQFESDMTITKWIESIHLEGGGGGNAFESYDMPYYFAAYHTKIDSMLKRKQKGFIFTFGDEPPPKAVSAAKVRSIIGDTLQADIPFADLLAVVRQSWIPYHICCMDTGTGSGYLREGMRAREEWKELFGQNVLFCDDHTKLSELIVSVLQVHAGEDVEEVSKSWSGTTAVTIRNAIKDLRVGVHHVAPLVDFE